MSNTCKNPPVFRYTWPGQDESFACAIHSMTLNTVARAMGAHVQFIRLKPEEMLEKACSQETEDDDD